MIRIKTLTYSLLTAIVLVSAIQNAKAQDVPAFPTAEGYGKWASGGRGGQVVEVTNLLDDPSNPPEGSLRWALKQYRGEPITIVFRVSGTIDLNGNDLRNNRSDITIAGQTAPGDGICIKGGCVNLGGSRNLIIRHIRSRVGVLDDNTYNPDQAPTSEQFIAGASLNIENGGNFIVDHCSFSWSAEENVGFYDNDNTTVQWCIFSEGLYDAGHGKGARSYGAVLGGKTATYHHNLLAHNKARSPRFGATTKNDVVMLLDFVNNVNYNAGGKTACYGGDNRQGDAGLFQLNYVNNYYKHGPAYTGEKSTMFVGASYCNPAQGSQGNSYGKWHLSGNYMDGTYAANNGLNTNNYKGLDISAYQSAVPGLTLNDMKSDHIYVAEPVNTQTAEEAYKSVLANVGAFPRDTIDRRIINETRTGTASRRGTLKSGGYVMGIINKPTDAGGYPDLKTYNEVTDSDHDGMDDVWETANGFNPADPADRNIVLKSGYTVLEAYLCSLVGEEIPLERSERFEITSEVVPAGTGAITRNPRSTSCAVGLTVTFKATPAFGYKFLYWSNAAGEILSTDSIYNHVVSKDETIRANFGHRPSYTLTCLTNGGKPSLLSQTPDPSLLEGRKAYVDGTEVTITASDHHFHVFDHWDDGSTDAERKIVLTQDTTVTAYYTDSAYLLAWDFSTEGNKAYKANQQREDGVSGTLYLTDDSGKSYAWDDYSTPKGGWMGQPAARNGYYVSDNAFFKIDCNAEDYGKLRLSFSYGAQNHVWSRYVMQYSVNEGDFTDFGEIAFLSKSLEKWMSTDFVLPSECDSCEEVCIRWYPDRTSSFLGNARGYEGFSLSEIYLLSGDIGPEPPSALPPAHYDNVIQSYTIYDLYGYKVAEGHGLVSPGTLRKGLYIVVTGSGDRHLTQF